ncbi:MAG TPA: RDD family protein [Stellaceae bacterium]|nr:RDD family protein [Stellaceae bacterium]
MSSIPPVYDPRSGQHSGLIDLNPSTEGVLGRRVVAYLFDLLFIALFAGVLSGAIAVLTLLSFGLLGHLFVLVPLTGLVYTTLLIGGGRGATWGMRIMNLGYRRMSDGRPPGLLEAFVVTVLFYLSVGITVWIVLLIPLFTNRHRTLHDLLTGLVMVRTDSLI